MLLKIKNNYNHLKSIYIYDLNEENNVIQKYIEVPIKENKLNIALRILNKKQVQVNLHVKFAICIKVLINNKIGWANINFFEEI